MNIVNTDIGYVPRVVRPLLAYAVQKVLPAVYDDSLSYYEVLAKVQHKLDEVVASLANLNDWQEAQDAVMTQLVQMVEDFINGGYKDDFDQFAQDWLSQNIQQALDEATHMVFFALTEDGYFTAFIPTKWSFVFDTVMDYADDNYGSLTIKY